MSVGLKFILSNLFLALLAGCGGLATSEGQAKLNTSVTQLNRKVIKVINHSSGASDADVSAQIEAMNSGQLQTDFKNDWHVDSVLVLSTFSSASDLTVYLVDVLPDSSKAGKVFGYHWKNNAYIDVKECLITQNLYQWQRTMSHETLELLLDTDAGTAYGNLVSNLHLAPRLEVCDPVENNYYSPSFGLLPTLADYVTPSWYGISLGKPYDHMQTLTEAGQVKS